MNAVLQEQHRAHLARRARMWRTPSKEACAAALEFSEPKAAAVETGPEPVEQQAYEPPPSKLFTKTEGAAAREALSCCGPTVRSIVKATAAYYDLPPEAPLVKRRQAEIMKPRQTAIAVTHSRTKLSLPDIGRRFGGYDHTTVLHAVRRADRDAVAAVCALLDETRAP